MRWAGSDTVATTSSIIHYENRSSGRRSRMRAFVNAPNAWRPPYAPTTLPVRPLRRRMGHPRTAAQPGRKARSTAQVACTPDRGRRLLLAQEWLLVADAAPRVPTLADGLLPFPQVAHRWTAPQSA